MDCRIDIFSLSLLTRTISIDLDFSRSGSSSPPPSYREKSADRVLEIHAAIFTWTQFYVKANDYRQ